MSKNKMKTSVFNKNAYWCNNIFAVILLASALIPLISCRSASRSDDLTRDEIAQIYSSKAQNNRSEINITLDDEYTFTPKTSNSPVVISDTLTDINNQEIKSENITNVIQDDNVINLDNISDFTEFNYLNNNNLTDNNNTDILDEQYSRSIETAKSKNDFTNSIVEYTFMDGKIYTIVTSKNSITDVRLEGGEEIISSIAVGDPHAWSIETALSVENGVNTVHILIRAESDDVITSAIIPTNRRTYYLRLLSTNATPMIACRFRYHNSSNMLIKNIHAQNSNYSVSKNKNSYSIDPSTLEFGYSVTDSSFIWSPTAVFSDNTTTYFQFDPLFEEVQGSPALYLSTNDEISLINYSIRGNLYTTKTILGDNQKFVLIKGKDIIEILRSNEE